RRLRQRVFADVLKIERDAVERAQVRIADGMAVLRIPHRIGVATAAAATAATTTWIGRSLWLLPLPQLVDPSPRYANAPNPVVAAIEADRNRRRSFLRVRHFPFRVGRTGAAARPHAERERSAGIELRVDRE